MSKKSRKRNKKILGILAAGLGAAALMKRKKRASMASMDDAGIGVTHSALTDSAPVTNVIKPTAPVDTAVTNVRKPPIGKMHGAGTDAEAIAGQDLRALHAVKANAPKGIMHPVYGQPTRTVPRVHNRFNRAKGGRIGAKSGGRVTGIAKRGFGRALMKGKK